MFQSKNLRIEFILSQPKNLAALRAAYFLPIFLCSEVIFHFEMDEEEGEVVRPPPPPSPAQKIKWYYDPKIELLKSVCRCTIGGALLGGRMVSIFVQILKCLHNLMAGSQVKVIFLYNMLPWSFNILCPAFIRYCICSSEFVFSPSSNSLFEQ